MKSFRQRTNRTNFIRIRLVATLEENEEWITVKKPPQLSG